MSEDPSKQKEELIRLITTAPLEAEKSESIAREAAEAARFTQDVAGPLADLVRQVAPDQLPAGDWARQIEGWRAWHDSVRQFLGRQPVRPADAEVGSLQSPGYRC